MRVLLFSLVVPTPHAAYAAAGAGGFWFKPPGSPRIRCCCAFALPDNRFLVSRYRTFRWCCASSRSRSGRGAAGLRIYLQIAVLQFTVHLDLLDSYNVLLSPFYARVLVALVVRHMDIRGSRFHAADTITSLRAFARTRRSLPLARSNALRAPALAFSRTRCPSPSPFSFCAYSAAARQRTSFASTVLYSREDSRSPGFLPLYLSVKHTRSAYAHLWHSYF